VSNDNEHLSQEEVDALFQQATGKSVARDQARPGPTPPEQRQQPGETPAPPEDVPAAVKAMPQPPKTPVAPAANTAMSPQPHGGNGSGLEEMRRLAEELNRTITGLDKRMSKLEVLVSQQKQSGGRNTTAQVSSLTHEVRSLKKDMDRLKTGLKSTPGYRLQKDFRCDSCGVHGAVATLHQCTSCGRQGWFGWWPSHTE
jgi:hypothetical protein